MGEANVSNVTTFLTTVVGKQNKTKCGYCNLINRNHSMLQYEAKDDKVGEQLLMKTNFWHSTNTDVLTSHHSWQEWRLKQTETQKGWLTQMTKTLSSQRFYSRSLHVLQATHNRNESLMQENKSGWENYMVNALIFSVNT